MTDCKVITVTSCKGGVGKSTIAANLGYFLSSHGSRVLLVDLDFGNRCLDLILGLESRALYDIKDVALSGISLSDAVCAFPSCERLHFCTAPFSGGDEIDGESFSRVIKKAREDYDYIILDTPGDIGHPFGLASAESDLALIVASHGPTAIRAAEHTGEQLRKAGVSDTRLIINNYDISDKKGISAGRRAGVIDIIDRTCIRLIGVIPYDGELAKAQENGKLVFTLQNGNTKTAFDNISKRIEGKTVRLFDGFRKISKKKII